MSEWTDWPVESGWYYVKHQHIPSIGTPCYVNVERRTFGCIHNGAWSERDYGMEDLAFMKIPPCPTPEWTVPR